MKKNTASRSTYWEKLKSPKWQKKRLEVMERANFECENCGDKDTTLNVHHLFYKKGADPWDYENDDLQCLCENCHAEDHELDQRLDAVLLEYKKLGRHGCNGKSYLIGIIQASMMGSGPNNELINLIDYEHCSGISDYYGYEPTQEEQEHGIYGADMILQTAEDNVDEYYLQHKQIVERFICRFQLEIMFRPEKIIGHVKMLLSKYEDSKKWLETDIEWDYPGFRYWPKKYQQEIYDFIKEIPVHTKADPEIIQ